MNSVADRIPPHATRVFKGVIFEVWQWEQEIFDGTRKTFEAVKRPDYADVIPVLENGKIVVLEQRQPHLETFFSFVGGRVDGGETPEQAAHRELREEAGLETSELVLWKRVQPMQKVIFEGHHYIARQCSVVGSPTMPEEEQITLHEMDFDTLIDFVIENERFRGTGAKEDFLRIKYDIQARAEMEKLLFG